MTAPWAQRDVGNWNLSALSGPEETSHRSSGSARRVWPLESTPPAGLASWQTAAAKGARESPEGTRLAWAGVTGQVRMEGCRGPSRPREGQPATVRRRSRSCTTTALTARVVWYRGSLALSFPGGRNHTGWGQVSLVCPYRSWDGFCRSLPASGTRCFSSWGMRPGQGGQFQITQPQSLLPYLPSQWGTRPLRSQPAPLSCPFPLQAAKD